MATDTLNPLLRFIRRIAVPSATGDLVDKILLERFATRRDGEAFAALVQRHGPLVEGVCRRMLRNDQDVEDAFQATFLVLVDKAAWIRRPELLGPWLYGVAVRISLKASASRAKRCVLERQGQEWSEPQAPVKEPTDDLWPVLDEELQRLPEKYRLPVVLCHLKGHSTEETARLLRCPRGTILSRLARARERLRARLTRRGLTLTAGSLTALLTEQPAQATISAALVHATVRMALVSTPNIGGTEGVPQPIFSLAKGVSRTMFLSKLRIALVLLVSGSVLALGAGMVTFRLLAGEPAEEKTEPPAKAPQKPADKLKDLIKAKLEAAKLECESRMKEFQDGRGTLDILVHSSRRLLESEREVGDSKEHLLTALETHFRLMKEIEEVNQERFNAGRISIMDVAQARYYRLEAEIWLERARAK